MSSSKLKLSKNHHYGCIGREKNEGEMLEVWQEGNKRIFNCHGGKESGKSCFIRKFMDDFIQNEASNYIVIDTDFKMERIGPKDSAKFWRNLARKLQRVNVKVQISDPMMEESLESFFEEIIEKKIIFLLDNLDYARNAKADDMSSTAEKDLFSELQDNFIPGIVERTDFSMVFITSTVQLRYGRTAPIVHKIEIDPLSTESAGELLLKTVELTSNMDKNTAREYLGPYLEPIALLSEGIPMAIIVTGTQLTENDRFIKPKEMLTVLIFSRMYTLSPEFFPKDDNMIKTYGDYIEKQSSGMKERLQDMGKTDSSSFTVESLRQHFPDKDGNLAFFKAQTVTPLLNRNFVKYVGNSGKSEMLEMPGFLRESLIIKKIIDSSKGLDDKVRLACRNVVHDCLHRLGKDFDEEKVKRIIENPQAYDEFVEQTIGNPTPEEDTFMDTQKDLGKNDLGIKPFTGYSAESILGCKQESNSPDLPEQRMQNLKLSEKVEDKRALNIRKESETRKGGDWASASTASHASKNNEEETEQEFLRRGVTENGQETNGMDTKNDKFNNFSNLSSSYGDKQYPHNKIAPSVMEDHTGPKATENEDGFSPGSSIELNNVRDQCTKQTDENDAKGNDLFEKTERKRLYVEHKVNRTSKDDEGYVSPHTSDSDDQGSPDPGVI